ncbi:hypothetical protein V5O48_012510 [Marasmius crinis-equi]|uniref:EF-hand domain-containing protein n=1 Tax=Marasmius crinis-equi TaxID=585013 RepID=A0ABR3F2Z3_9AGAR
MTSTEEQAKERAPQTQQFEEASQLIDHDKHGWASEADLKEIFASLGITPTQTQLSRLLPSRLGGQSALPSNKGNNFTMSLTMMSERLFEFDTEPELFEAAFKSFDENDEGTVKVDVMRKWLSKVGERMSEEEIDRFLKGSFTDRQGILTIGRGSRC